MPIALTPGQRVISAVCSTELIVVRAPSGAIDLTIGGAAVLPHGSDRPEGAGLDQRFADGTLIGKRYVDVDGQLELLCTKAGAGSPAVDGHALVIKEAKPLPASD
jgi:hypothetical protein